MARRHQGASPMFNHFVHTALARERASDVLAADAAGLAAELAERRIDPYRAADKLLQAVGHSEPERIGVQTIE